MLGVSADEGEQDPWSEQRRLGVPVLLREIPPRREAAGQEQKEAGEPVHGGDQCGDCCETMKKCEEVQCRRCLFTLRSLLSRGEKSVQRLLMCQGEVEL